MDTTKLFDNKYKIIKVLGKGGMGTVYLAENIKLSTLWAIKEINKKSCEHLDLLAEPNILKRLNHFALPRIFDIVEDENSIYIIEDYVEGNSLDKELKRRGSFSEERVIKWANQIGDALHYLHTLKPNPIIYRDMKPSNIMVDEEDNIKIIDFGIAREYKADSECDTTYIGTRGYAAPEQYGTSQTDERTDIFSLGATFYHLLSGKSPNEPPFEFIPIRELNENLSEGIEYIIQRCTQADPNKRYQSVEDLMYDLNNISMLNNACVKKKKTSFVRKLLFAVVLCGVSFLTFGGIIQLQIEKQERYDQSVAEGKRLINSEQYDEALKSFRSAIEEIPEKADAYAEIANMYLLQEDYDKCVDYIQNELLDRIETIENNDRVNYILGTAYLEKRNYKEAIQYLKRANELVPLNLEYSNNLAINYAKLGEVSKCEEILIKIKKNYAEEYKAYMMISTVYVDIEHEKSIEKRDYNKAIEMYNLAVKYAPDGENNEDLKSLSDMISELKEDNLID